MIRWYAVTCWDVLEALGYDWVMRMDDDSFLLSPVSYNVFDEMRKTKKVYGFRSFARECDKTFGAFVDQYISTHENALLVHQLEDDGTAFCEKFPKHCDNEKRRPSNPRFQARLTRPKRYCEGPGRVGFYNNFFITYVPFWTSEKAKLFRKAFDDSALIFSHRANDLIFHAALVRLLLPRDAWRRFADFSYLHHTVRDGAVAWGGLETGYDDPNAEQTVDSYLTTWHPPESITSSTRLRTCNVQLTLGDSRYRRLLYVPHGLTRWRDRPPAAPYCNLNGFAPIW